VILKTKLDEEKSKHADLVQENSLAQHTYNTSWWLVKGHLLKTITK
jgi:hypothetical protein